MPSRAIVQLVGHLGRDPESRYTPSGKLNVTFSVAVSEKYNETETTTWFRVTAWGRLAETMDTLSQGGSLVKGALVWVSGRIKQREYQTDNGQTRTSLDVNADEILVLGHGNGNRSNGGQSQQQQENEYNSVPF